MSALGICPYWLWSEVHIWQQQCCRVVKRQPRWCAKSFFTWKPWCAHTGLGHIFKCQFCPDSLGWPLIQITEMPLVGSISEIQAWKAISYLGPKCIRPHLRAQVSVAQLFIYSCLIHTLNQYKSLSTHFCLGGKRICFSFAYALVYKVNLA